MAVSVITLDYLQALPTMPFSDHLAVNEFKREAKEILKAELIIKETRTELDQLAVTTLSGLSWDSCAHLLDVLERMTRIAREYHIGAADLV